MKTGTWQCPHGYVLDGEPRPNCVADGNGLLFWSHKPPSCIGKLNLPGFIYKKKECFGSIPSGLCKWADFCSCTSPLEAICSGANIMTKNKFWQVTISWAFLSTEGNTKDRIEWFPWPGTPAMGAVRIRHHIREIATQPVILWILLGGKLKWLPMNFGINDVMRTAPIVFCLRTHQKEEKKEKRKQNKTHTMKPLEAVRSRSKKGEAPGSHYGFYFHSASWITLSSDTWLAHFIFLSPFAVLECADPGVPQTRWASRSTFSQWFEVGVRLQCRLLPGGACQPGLPERSHLEWTRTILQKGKAIICSNSGVFRSGVRVVLCGGGGGVWGVLAPQPLENFSKQGWFDLNSGPLLAP